MNFSFILVPLSFVTTLDSASGVPAFRGMRSAGHSLMGARLAADRIAGLPRARAGRRF